ncbi:aldo/keto reductase [Lactobacillus sp. ESL0701]|uniref:aldo/keto reductase n=1 Tax=Lactobacillus sp. ESL0701 TaxID=2983217 RepID=UPI0023F94732|nr:aldo/keto reductase [Lactobacillus sp. ESL0701]MDF7671679.1 aldo/keto reductase [Lactobacillus sp. ESL0701]
MKQVKINGRMVPAIGIGTWHMGSDSAKQQVETAAIQAGIAAGAKLIDTAEIYGKGASETLVGQAIKPYKREELFVVSKVWPENATKKDLEQHLDASLDRLKTDYLDMYLLHWRDQVPLEESIAELDRMREKGKIKSWGVSNFDVADLEEVETLPAGQNLAANEDLYNLNARGLDFDLIPWQKERDIPLLAYSPVGGLNNNLHTDMLTNPVIEQIAHEHNASVYQVLLSWTIRDGITIAIPQTANADHMRDNIAAANLELTSADLAAIDEQYPRPTHKIPLDLD